MKKVLFTLFLALILLPNAALGATFASGQNVVANETVSDDLYVSGGVVSIPSDINGDLVIGGGQVQVDGNVSQDLMAGGGDITVVGEVGDDVRTVGGNLRIDTTIKGDLLGAAGNITLTDKSYVGGDVNMAGGDLLIGGTINGDLRLAGSSVYLNASVAGNVTLLNFNKITFGPQAKILGTLWYRAHEKIEIPANVVSGEVTFVGIPESQIKENLPSIIAGFSLFSYLSTLLFGLFLIWIFRYSLLHTANVVNEAALRSLGVGFLVLVLTPIAALIFLITTIGVPVAIVLMALWLIFLYVGKVMAAALIGFKIIRVNEKNGFGRVFGSFALGALIFAIIGMVPVAGWLLNLLFVLTALGGFVLYGLEAIEHLRKKKIA